MKRLIYGLLGAVALLGCGGGGGGSSSSATVAHITYVNASPDAGDLAFGLNGTTKAPDVAFGTATAFSDVKPADYDVSIFPPASSAVIWDESQTVASNTDYVALAVGLRNPDLSQDTEREKRLVLAMGSINRTAPTGSRARLFVVHAFVRQVGFSTPTIDFRNPEDTPVIDSTGIAFGEIRSIDVDSGSETFQVRQTDTDQIFVSSTVTLDPASIYLVLVSGQEGATGASAPAIRYIKLATR